MLLTKDDGAFAQDEAHAEQLKNGGFLGCYGPKCNFFLSPESQQRVLNQGSGYYTCPNHKCKQSHDIMEDVPWHGNPALEQMGVGEYEEFKAGGGTRIGLSMKEQAQIGENLIKDQHSLPGYGPIVWWHPGDATSSSPLDGATKEWGIEVKTLSYDTTHHRFIPNGPEEKAAKNKQAEEMGLKGVLGILVMLNFRTSTADVYVKEMTLEPWSNGAGRMLRGVASFRTNTSQHLLERLPFKNPFINPASGLPHTPAHYGTPQSEDEVPF